MIFFPHFLINKNIKIEIQIYIKNFANNVIKQNKKKYSDDYNMNSSKRTIDLCALIKIIII